MDISFFRYFYLWGIEDGVVDASRARVQPAVLDTVDNGLRKEKALMLSSSGLPLLVSFGHLKARFMMLCASRIESPGKVR